MDGMVDLTVSVKSINPDALVAEFALTGLPYGMIASRAIPEELFLRLNSRWAAGGVPCGCNERGGCCADAGAAREPTALGCCRAAAPGSLAALASPGQGV
jgi:hypothetical protein